MPQWIEIRDGKRYRVTLLPDKAKLPPKKQVRRDPGPTPFPQTKYPFTAYINGEPRVYEVAPR